MRYNFKDVDMNFLENISDSFNFYLDDFCEALLNKKEGYPSFSKETLKQLLILNNNISDQNIDLSDVKTNIEMYRKVYFSRRFLSRYIESDPLDVEELNDILLKLYCLREKDNNTNEFFYSNKENIKRLMRVVKLDSEFYLENIERLGKFYNILKRNNPELKDDGVKLVNAIEIRKPSLEEQLHSKYNLSSKQVFTLDPKYFFTEGWRFNFEAIYDKYPDELDAALTEVFLDLDKLKAVKSIGLVHYLSSDNEKLEEIFKNIVIYESEIDSDISDLKIENVIKFISACNSRTETNPKLFQDIDPTDWMQETLNELMLKIPEGFPLHIVNVKRFNNVYYSSYRRDKLKNWLQSNISQTAFENALKLFL